MKHKARSRPSIGTAAVALVAASLVLTACSGAAGSTASGSAPAQDTGKKTVVVFAAASLKSSFTTLAEKLHDEHPELDLKFNFAGSQDLVAQIKAGAKADVVATADLATMGKLQDAGSLDGAARNFASNTLTIAVPPSNPANISALADLARPGVKTVLCAVQVPCGAASHKVEKAAGLDLKPVSEELAVTDVLGKVSSGEADAGLVYRTDVQGSKGAVKAIDFPQSSAAVNTYAVALVNGGPDSDGGKTFLAALTGDPGRKVLADAGFGKP
ncbi:molybdate transport system substrate-binding protein [Arthrobacter woluwensis]|uniref:molybdate ABC transporter substrate-binding protein n=1 Tax=Arthrobacter woluwensis TaxID=156980 RepID=UPI002786D3C7|nr:molybdate ABC transporter substrate-binding protein [Arthrobacter woluwensis]MDQ0708084.1 molybdate transport system substrate-binding protein [Arthrobacter woluwensis]